MLENLYSTSQLDGHFGPTKVSQETKNTDSRLDLVKVITSAGRLAFESFCLVFHVEQGIKIRGMVSKK